MMTSRLTSPVRWASHPGKVGPVSTSSGSDSGTEISLSPPRAVWGDSSSLSVTTSWSPSFFFLWNHPIGTSPDLHEEVRQDPGQEEDREQQGGQAGRLYLLTERLKDVTCEDTSDLAQSLSQCQADIGEACEPDNFPAVPAETSKPRMNENFERF